MQRLRLVSMPNGSEAQGILFFWLYEYGFWLFPFIAFSSETQGVRELRRVSELNGVEIACLLLMPSFRGYLLG